MHSEVWSPRIADLRLVRGIGHFGLSVVIRLI
jgi:hypothetical protein